MEESVAPLYIAYGALRLAYLVVFCSSFYALQRITLEVDDSLSDVRELFLLIVLDLITLPYVLYLTFVHKSPTKIDYRCYLIRLCLVGFPIGNLQVTRG